MQRKIFYENKEYEKIINGFKLKFDSLPSYVHGKNIRTEIRTLWDKIRKQLLEENNYTCSICGFNPEPSEYRFLHLHEEWGIDKDNRILNLLKLDVICKKCHDVEHAERTLRLRIPNQKEIWIEHIMKVNNCNKDVAQYYVDKFYYEHSLEAIMERQGMLSDKELEQRLLQLKKESNLAKAKWKFSVYDKIPYGDKVVEALKKKDLYI